MQIFWQLFLRKILKVFQNGQLFRLQSYKLFLDYVSLLLQKNYKKNVPTSDTFFSLRIPFDSRFHATATLSGNYPQTTAMKLSTAGAESGASIRPVPSTLPSCARRFSTMQIRNSRRNCRHNIPFSARVHDLRCRPRACRTSPSSSR